MYRIIYMVFTLGLVLSCSHGKSEKAAQEELNALHFKLDSIQAVNAILSKNNNNQIATFLTFQKENAEQAMNFYVALFDNSEIIEVQRWGKEAPGKEGTIMSAKFTLNGKPFMCSDSPPIHEWGFTPAVSNFVSCANEVELEYLFAKLSENGQVMMPLANYDFSKKFGFVEDQFGVSWQLNLE